MKETAAGPSQPRAESVACAAPAATHHHPHAPMGDAGEARAACAIPSAACWSTPTPRPIGSNMPGGPTISARRGAKPSSPDNPAKYLAPSDIDAAASRAGGHDLHLPDASADPPGGAGVLPDLRHGAGARTRHGGVGAEPRARRHDPALLAGARSCASGRGPRDGRPSRQPAHASSARNGRTGCSSCSRLRWCCGRVGRSSCAAGNRSSRAISTCSP